MTSTGKSQELLEPGPAPDHLGDVDPALLDQARGGVVEAVALALDVRGLRLQIDDAELPLLEPASLLDRVEQLPVVEVAVAEVPAVDDARHELAVAHLVVVDVAASPVRQRE